jgi:transcription termination factor Rho
VVPVRGVVPEPRRFDTWRLTYRYAFADSSATTSPSASGRIVEGGADVDAVYNFALVSFFGAALEVGF